MTKEEVARQLSKERFTVWLPVAKAQKEGSGEMVTIMQPWRKTSDWAVVALAVREILQNATRVVLDDERAGWRFSFEDGKWIKQEGVKT